MKLTYAQIQAIAAQLSSSSTQMKSILDELNVIFSNVGEGSAWSGTAASQAKESFDQLSQKFPEFYESIENCNKYLLRVVENYQNVDKAVTGQ